MLGKVGIPFSSQLIYIQNYWDVKISKKIGNCLLFLVELLVFSISNFFGGNTRILSSFELYRELSSLSISLYKMAIFEILWWIPDFNIFHFPTKILDGAQVNVNRIPVSHLMKFINNYANIVYFRFWPMFYLIITMCQI